MTKKELLKAGITAMVSTGVGCIVSNAVAFTTPTLAIGFIKKACIGVGSFAISAMASEKVSEYATLKVDRVFDYVTKIAQEGEEDGT